MNKEHKNQIVGILLGESKSVNRAKLIVDTYKECPYCVIYINKDRTVIGVFNFPYDHKWYLEWTLSNPEETLGLKRVEIFFAKGLRLESSWSLGEVKSVLDKAPCGASCSSCFQYKDRCEGCPSTKFYTNY
jgi:hypothetical protein